VSRYLNPGFWHRNLTTFQKLVIANSAIIVVGAVGGPLITLEVTRALLPVLLIFLLGGLITILVVNFLILLFILKRLLYKPFLAKMEPSVKMVLSSVTDHASFAVTP